MVIEGQSRRSVERYGDYMHTSDYTGNCEVSLYASKVRMNRDERDEAKEYHAEKKLKAKAEADAEAWWVENNEKLVKMDVKGCHEYLKKISVNHEVRPKVHKILYEWLCQWKGSPPPPPKPPLRTVYPW